MLSSQHNQKSTHTNPPPIKRVHFYTIDSTQYHARDHYNQDLDNNHWLVYTANQQTQGIGQHHRLWHSPPSNVYATFCFTHPNDLDPATLKFQLSQIAALTICQTLESFDLKAEVKWKNDVLVNRRKIAGNLTEVKPYSSHQFAVLIGIGINVNMNVDHFQTINQPATSMKVELNQAQSIEIEQVLHQLEKNLYNSVQQFQGFGFTHFIQALDQRLAFRDEYVLLEECQHHNQTSMQGWIKGVTEAGFLLLQLENTDNIEVIKQGRIVKEPDKLSHHQQLTNQ